MRIDLVRGHTRGRRAQTRARWRAIAHGDGHRNHGRSKTFPGGLGYAKIELNHRVDVPSEFKYLAKAGYFEIDVYAPASGTGIEYNGSDHLDKQRSASDAERMTVLSALGFRMIVLTGTQFAHQLQLHRAVNAIALAMGLTCDRSEAFQKRQNDLREFVIRHWGGGL